MERWREGRARKTEDEGCRLPLRAWWQIDAGECLARSNCRANKYRRIAGRVRSIQRWRPGTTDRHCLIFTQNANQEVNDARRVHEINAILLFGCRKAFSIEFGHWRHTHKHHLGRKWIIRISRFIFGIVWLQRFHRFIENMKSAWLLQWERCVWWERFRPTYVRVEEIWRDIQIVVPLTQFQDIGFRTEIENWK